MNYLWNIDELKQYSKVQENKFQFQNICYETKIHVAVKEKYIISVWTFLYSLCHNFYTFSTQNSIQISTGSRKLECNNQLSTLETRSDVEGL